MPRYVAFAWVVLTFLLSIWSILRAKKKTVPELRKLTALDVISSAIKRCAEMGRPLMLYDGLVGDRGSAVGMQVISTISYISRIAAEQGTPTHYVMINVGGIPYLEDAIDSACISVGKPEQRSNQKVYCWGMPAPGVENFAACAEWIRNTHLWKPATTVVFTGGRTTANTLDGSKSLEDNFIVGGTNDLAQAGWYVLIGDYFIMPEEIMGMGAYLNRDPMQLNTLLVSDIIRFGVYGLMVLLAVVFYGTRFDVETIVKV